MLCEVSDETSAGNGTPDPDPDSGDICDSSSIAYDPVACQGDPGDGNIDDIPPPPCTLTCEGNFTLDPDNCACVCNLTCPIGYKLDEGNCECEKLPPCDQNQRQGILPSGKVIGVFFQGGPTGGGNTVSAIDAGGTGDHYAELVFASAAEGKPFIGEVIAPGWTATSGVQQGLSTIQNSYLPGDQVVIYGYSYGVDLAVDLTTVLKNLNIPVNLLITVDGSDGPF